MTTISRSKPVGGTSNIVQATGDPSGPAESAGPEQLLPDPADISMNGDMGAQIAALLVTCTREERKTLSNVRATQEAAIEAANEREVEALRAKADDTAVEGWFSGGVQMAGGGASMASAMQSSSSASDSWKATGDLVKGAGGIVDGSLRGNIDRDAADQTQAQNEAERAKRGLSQTDESIDDARALLRDALEFYKQYEQTKNQTSLITASRS